MTISCDLGPKKTHERLITPHRRYKTRDLGGSTFSLHPQEKTERVFHYAWIRLQNKGFSFLFILSTPYPRYTHLRPTTNAVDQGQCRGTRSTETINLCTQYSILPASIELYKSTRYFTDARGILWHM